MDTTASLALIRLHDITADLRQILGELEHIAIPPEQKRGLETHLTQVRDEIDEYLHPIAQSNVQVATPFEYVGNGLIRSKFVSGDPKFPGVVVAEIPHWIPNQDKIGHQLAAAPEMLSVLDRIEWLCRDDLPSSIAGLVRAAIAKAEGCNC